ncbi:SufS family cysteine desulfurase [Fusibacter ferrireducens]|uniref:cysteine desulfurase n=1 Tax=Fusibacter ferrireducens TaxID=2785058 RepID=A0ABR9ZR17_9FIRM|nr:SufS family cysteine desulfurase [Fusibacter ferrireducens]MBF4692891.1 SufS family cysteine desulfurase [Fusibacter ferrireducens]
MNEDVLEGTYKSYFPVFEAHPDLIYLDHAATSQKPLSVIEAIKDQMTFENGSPNRGAHKLSVKATEIYDNGRRKVIDFIGGMDPREIVFTKNATESLNLIAYSYGMNFLKHEDEIAILISSHHSNIVPWQMVAQKTGAKLVYLMVDSEGKMPASELDKINERTKIVTFPWISNGIGTRIEPKRLIEKAHEMGAVAIIDAAQVAGHERIDIAELDADFLVFSGHKMFGPQGIGVLYGKYELLEKMPPFLTGGDMIEYVTCFETTYEEVPKRFEAGTQNVSGVKGLVAAIDFIEAIGMHSIQNHERKLTQYIVEQLKKLPFITIYGAETLADRGGLVVFNVTGVHPHDVASILDDYGIAIRAGHHCTQPLMQHLELTATCRASYSLYNSEQDVDRLIKALFKVRKVFGYDD